MKKINKLSFDIYYSKAAEKFFVKHEKVRTQYENDICKIILNENRESVDVKKIKGTKGDYYRIRIGSYRVIYTIINNRIVVVNTLFAGPRGDIYKKM